MADISQPFSGVAKNQTTPAPLNVLLSSWTLISISYEPHLTYICVCERAINPTGLKPAIYLLWSIMTPRKWSLRSKDDPPLLKNIVPALAPSELAFSSPSEHSTLISIYLCRCLPCFEKNACSVYYWCVLEMQTIMKSGSALFTA